ncbi:MAG: serine hydrolase [Bacteroidetes bacterium]|nr:MAG: serine hydrolase [Bacteroidota bacterium]
MKTLSLCFINKNNKMQIKYRFIGVLIFLFVTSVSFAQTARLDSLDAYFQRSLALWDVPGMAIAIVKDDSLVFAKGYGVKNIEKKRQKVDANTLFPIASNTKAFTAAALARLVDQGKLTWDTKVVDILPYFNLYDPYVTAHFTIVDLLSHRSGLETFSGDLIWYGTTYSREEVVRKLGYLKQKYEFRTHFGYSNIMYIAAGEIIKKLTGKPWEQYIQEEFLNPLGMKQTLTSIKQLTKKSNVTKPHNKVNDEVFPIEFMNWDNISGAGALISNVTDMSYWLRMQLHEGAYKGHTYFSPEQNLMMKSPHINHVVSKGYRHYWPSTHFRAYGMGWGLNDYHGREIISHSGGYDGIISFSCLVPEENLGFVILTNSNSSLYNSLKNRILDAFLAKDTIDWNQLLLPYQQKNDRRVPIAIRPDATKPSLDLVKYTGIFSDPIYGNVMVSMEDDKLKLQMLRTALFSSDLSPFDGDTMIVEFKKVPSLPQGKVFFYTKDKDVEYLIIDVPNPDFDFTEFKFMKMKGTDNPKVKKQ